VLAIPVEQVQRFPGQPRTSFEHAAIEALAKSIEAIGQRTPGEVRPLSKKEQKAAGPFRYMLIDGERRLKACRLLGIPFRTIVKEVENEIEHFAYSVASNFCRVGHTPMETARAFKRLLDSGKNVDFIASITGRSAPSVYQHLSLNHLHEEVQQMVDRREENGQASIAFTIALQLTSLQPAVQLEAAQYITANKLRMTQARHYIKALTDNNPTRTLGAHARQRPEREVGSLVTFANRTLAETSGWLQRSPEAISTMIQSLRVEETMGLAATLDSITTNIDRLKVQIAKAAKEKVRRSNMRQ